VSENGQDNRKGRISASCSGGKKNREVSVDGSFDEKHTHVQTDETGGDADHAG
jgi:hypothetical protein